MEELLQKIIKKYSFLEVNPEHIYELYSEIILEQETTEINLDELETLIRERLYQEISELDFIRLFNDNYIPSMKENSNPKDAIYDIEDHLEKLGYTLSIDQIIYLLKNNNFIYSCIKKIVNKNKRQITTGDIDLITDSFLLSSLIENYCELNNIKIKSDFDITQLENLPDGVQLYLESINLPLLSPLEEKKLFIEYNEGSEKAKDILIERNLRLVVNIARRHQNRGLDLLDLIQEGNLGLIKAVEEFKVMKGYKFSTYATWWIRQAITRAIADKGRNIRIPVHNYEMIGKVKKCETRLSYELGRDPTIEEVAKAMDMPLEDLKFLKSVSNDTTSINQSVGDDEDTELGAFIKDESASVEEDYIASELPRQIEDLFNKVTSLTPKEKMILIKRFGIIDGDPKTLEEVGQELKVTRERIRQIEKKALRKLRNSRYARDFAVYMDNPSEAISNLHVPISDLKAQNEEFQLDKILQQDVFDSNIENISKRNVEILIEVLNKLNSNTRKLLKLYLGFYNGKRINSYEKIRLLQISYQTYQNRIKKIKDVIKSSYPEIEDVDDFLNQFRIATGEILDIPKPKKESNISSEVIILQKKEVRNMENSNEKLNKQPLPEENKELIEQILSKLNEEDQQILKLFLGMYDGERLDNKQKSEKLGMAVPTYYDKMTKIKAKIKAMYPEIEDLEDLLYLIKRENGENMKGYRPRKDSKKEVKIAKEPESDISQSTNHKLINQIFEELSVHEKKVLQLYLGFYEGKRLYLNEKSVILGIAPRTYNYQIVKIIESIKKSHPEIEDISAFFNQFRRENGEHIKNPKSKRNAMLDDNAGTSEIDIKPVLPPKAESIEANPSITDDLSALLKNPTFKELMENLTIKDAVIVGLRFGFLGRCYKIEEIAKFLGIHEEEVIDSIRNILLSYKEKLNTLIDRAITDDQIKRG